MRRVIAFLLLFACLVSLFVVYTAAADADGSTDAGNPEGEYRRVNLTETSVMEDLKAVEEQQKGQAGGFKISDYPAVPFSKKFVFLALTEDFRIDSNAKREYGLYLYLYNPGRLTVEVTDPQLQNALQMSVDGVDDGHFAKYSLQLVSYSDDKLFYKFYVTVPDGFARKLSVSRRNYNISGIEIAAKYDSNVAVRDHSGAADGSVQQTIKISYTGHTPSKCSTIAGDDLLHLDINLAYYRVSDGADLNKYKQLMTAWFMLPRKYVSDDGTVDLRYINYLCEKKADQNVMADKGIGQLFESGQGSYGGNRYDINIPLKVSVRVDTYESKLNHAGKHTATLYDYNHYLFSNYYLNDSYKSQFSSEKINYTNINRHTLAADESIDIISPFFYGSKPSSASLHELMTDYKHWNYAYARDYQQIGGNIDVKDPSAFYNTVSYKNATQNFSGFFQRVKDYGFFEAIHTFFSDSLEDDSLSNLQLFTIVDPADSSLSRQDFANKYKIDASLVGDIKYRAGSSNYKDYYVCLFRFDIADYSILFDGSVYEKIKEGWFGHEEIVGYSKVFVTRYIDGAPVEIECTDRNAPKIYKMAMYRNFDILDLTFGTPDDYKIVPVNADPIKFYAGDVQDKEDLKPDFTPPPWWPDSSKKDWTPLIIAAIVLIVAVALIVPLSRASGTVYNGVSKAGKSVVAGVKKLDQKIRRKKKKK